MTIRCQCKGCSARFDAPDALAGKAVRCPKCKAAIRLPGAKHEGVAASTPPGGATQDHSLAGRGPSWFVRDTEGRHHGPMSKAELDRLVATERLDGLCQLRRADWEDWRWIETVYEQFVEPDAADETDLADEDTVAGPRLAECPDCGKIVSRRATQCPNCGCPIAAMESRGTRDVDASEFHPRRRGELGKAVFLTALVLFLMSLLAGSGYLGWQLWQKANRPAEILLPLQPPQASPVAPAQSVAVEPATPEQITAWIDEVASQTARQLDAEYQRMYLARTGIQAMQQQAELIDSLVTGEFAKSAKHDKPKRPPPPPYQSRYEPLREECVEYLKKNTNPKAASRASIVEQAKRWADTRRSPMQKALEEQLGVPPP
ncbi:MAG: hypothetical protein U9N87_15080 [Planctomycetota bacterium]|nr:hypothetical protein [Planctomycetota bacterium]